MTQRPELLREAQRRLFRPLGVAAVATTTWQHLGHVGERVADHDAGRHRGSVELETPRANQLAIASDLVINSSPRTNAGITTRNRRSQLSVTRRCRMRAARLPVDAKSTWG